MSYDRTRLSLPVQHDTQGPARMMGFLQKSSRLLPDGDHNDSDAGGSGDKDADKDKGSEGTDSDGKTGGDKGSDDKSKGDPQAKITALEEEKERHYRQRQAAEKRADDLEKRLKDLEDKDKPELERKAALADELVKTVKDLEEKLNRAHIDNAFLRDNTYDWHSPSRALSLADLTGVEVDKEGNVHNLKKALEDLAKSDAYLLKPKEDTKDKDDPADGKTKTGDTANKSKQTDKGNPDREALVKKYPGLRR